MKSAALILVVILLLTGVAAGYYVLDQENKKELIREGTYKIDITGKAHYGVAGVGGFYISDLSYVVTKMTSADLQSTLWAFSWPWQETGKITVKAAVYSPTTPDAWEKTVDIGKFHTWTGGEQPFIITLSFIPPNTSPYRLVAGIYEDGALKNTYEITGILIPGV